jgi:hypothetical protein
MNESKKKEIKERTNRWRKSYMPNQISISCPICGCVFYGVIDWAIEEKHKHIEQQHFQTNKSVKSKPTGNEQ